MGDKSGLTEDCTSGEFRDRASFDLPGVQEELVRAVVATGTPVVLVLVVGRPVGERVAARALRRRRAWPGSRARRARAAIADVLSGEANPGGKLPDLVPESGRAGAGLLRAQGLGRAVATERATTSTCRRAPLYPFGHGLSYTTFELSEARDPRADGALGRRARRRRRAGQHRRRAGDEVVQLYIRDPQASVTRPVLELKSFVRVDARRRVSRRRITFRVPVAQLGFYDRELDVRRRAGRDRRVRRTLLRRPGRRWAR